MALQKDFEQLEQAQAYYRHLKEKLYEGVIVMLLEKKGYFRSFLLNAGVNASTVKPRVRPARLEVGAE